MAARHETEVVISPTIKSELGKFVTACPRLPMQDGRAAGGRLGSNRPRMQCGATSNKIPKNAVLVEAMREEEMVANFEQVRAKVCATEVPCLNVVARKPSRQRGEAW
jgi:hypothetical protein